IILSFPHDLVRFTTIVSLLFISFFFYFYCDLRFLHSFPTRRSSYLREYLPAAREAIAVSANPNGSACYDASVRYHSSLPTPASEVHATGLREVERLDAEMKAIGERSFGTGNVPRLLQRARTDKAFLFKSPEELIARSQAAL